MDDSDPYRPSDIWETGEGGHFNVLVPRVSLGGVEFLIDKSRQCGQAFSCKEYVTSVKRSIVKKLVQIVNFHI